MLTNEIKTIIKNAFNEMIREGGQINSKREFFVENLSQTIFESEQEAQEFVRNHWRELYEFFLTVDPSYRN